MLKSCMRAFILDKIVFIKMRIEFLKKAFLLVGILISSLLCTACINNFAIQELNQIGMKYLEKGDYDNAISRFKSSIDLDENVFETRYNLGVAYVSKEDYEDAIEQLELALQIKPDSKEACYSLAVALEGLGMAIDEDKEDDTPLTKKEVEEALSFVQRAVEVYEKYISFGVEPSENEKVLHHIEKLNQYIEDKKTEYKISKIENGDKE